MKCWDYEAVIYDGEIYCIDCLPEDISLNDAEVEPIFASEEWQIPGATCSRCKTLHDYMGLI